MSHSNRRRKKLLEVFSFTLFLQTNSSVVAVVIAKAGHQGELGVGNVLVLVNLHGCDRQEATEQ